MTQHIFHNRLDHNSSGKEASVYILLVIGDTEDVIQFEGLNSPFSEIILVGQIFYLSLIDFLYKVFIDILNRGLNRFLNFRSSDFLNKVFRDFLN